MLLVQGLSAAGAVIEVSFYINSTVRTFFIQACGPFLQKHNILVLQKYIMSLPPFHHNSFFFVFYKIQAVAACCSCIKFFPKFENWYKKQAEHIVFYKCFIPSVLATAAAHNRLVIFQSFSFRIYSCNKKHIIIPFN